MATLGQYAKAQTRSGAAAESGLQALMLLMQYMQQREDRSDEREWRQTNIENVRLQMEKMRMELGLSRPGAQSFRNIEDVKDGSAYNTLDSTLDDLGTITGAPELAQTDAVKAGLKTPLGRTTAMVTERLGIPQQEWSKAWGEVLALRADLAETTKGVDPARRDQLLREMDAKIRRSMGVDSARYGVLSQQALVRHFRQEGWSDGEFPFEATDIAWLREQHGGDEFISDVLQFNQKKPRWTIDDELRRTESEQAVIDGPLDKVIGDIEESAPEMVEGIDVSAIKNLPPEIQQEARDIVYRQGPGELQDFLLEHAAEPEVDQTPTRGEEYLEFYRDLTTRVAREGPAALLPDEAAASGLAWLAEQAQGFAPFTSGWFRGGEGDVQAPAPTLDDLVAGEETVGNRIDVNRIDLGEGMGPPPPPPQPAPPVALDLESLMGPLEGVTPEDMMWPGNAGASPPPPATLGTFPNVNRFGRSPEHQERMDARTPIDLTSPDALYQLGWGPTPEERADMHGVATTRGGDVQLEKKFMELQELLGPGSQYQIPTDPSMNPETGREMWPVPADVPYGEQFMGMPMEELQASDQAYETIAAEAQKEHEVNMFMQAMAQKQAMQGAQQRREQISTLLRDASIEEEMIKANKMQMLFDLMGQEPPYYLQRP